MTRPERPNHKAKIEIAVKKPTKPNKDKEGSYNAMPIPISNNKLK
ncbi:hypothetical protein GCM10023338_08460 [Wohlfahrtiimonas larvae]|uniref:Uncharacterized protein n=1 Tax=Wohlfahrtiimonas larvae TaxID=1157986 RepID=A0ABP9MPJ8_9GAMM